MPVGPAPFERADALVDLRARVTQHGARALAQQLPGHDIGMMLHGANNNFITGLNR